MMNLTESEIGKCLSFSYEVTKRTDKYYKKRNIYATTEKLIMDHALAKMSEIVVYKSLSSKGYKISYPSFKLEYDATEDSDMYIIKDGKEIKLHVKVCRFDSPVKESWLIQRSSLRKLGNDDFFALCVFNSPTSIDIKKMIAANDIEWKQPRHPSLKSKAACYLVDMI
jgi:hypothetical protein